MAYGQWDEEGGWANRLRKYFDSKVLPQPFHYYIFYNLSIPNHTLRELLDRFKSEAIARLRSLPGESEYMFIFAIGTNDSRYFKKESKRDSSPEEFKKNLLQLISMAQKLSEKIVFVGLLPCNEEQVQRRSEQQNWPEVFGNESIFEFNSILESICKEKSLHFIDLFSKFKEIDYTHLLSDGIHLNSAGHTKAYSIIKSYLITHHILEE